MRLPNGYGSVVKLGGKRRKPYAVRTSDICQYIDIHAPYGVPDNVRKEFKRLKFRWNKVAWTGLHTEQSKEFADNLEYEYSIVYRQSYKFHAYFEKSDLAYAYLAEMNNGNIVTEQVRFTDSPTFAEMYGKWKAFRKSLKNQIAPSTWRNYEIAFNHFAPLHHKKFIALRANDIQEVVTFYNCKSQATVGNMRAILKGMYSYAKMNDYTDKDISEFIVYEWNEDVEQIHEPYTEEEIKVLWENLYKINNVDIILIYIYTGMRTSELLEITTDNVHLDEQYIIGGMKTENGKDRIIPIADKILPLVKNRYDKDRKYLINNRYGNKYTYKTYVSANFNTVINKLGFQHLPYDTRHTFATLMKKAKADPDCTKLIMGHSLKDDITIDVYTHISKDELLAEINKI